MTWTPWNARNTPPPPAKSMNDKDRKASLKAWMASRHRIRLVARNPQIAATNPKQIQRDVNKIDKLLKSHLKTLGW